MCELKSELEQAIKNLQVISDNPNSGELGHNIKLIIDELLKTKHNNNEITHDNEEIASENLVLYNRIKSIKNFIKGV